MDGLRDAGIHVRMGHEKKTRPSWRAKKGVGAATPQKPTLAVLVLPGELCSPQCENGGRCIANEKRDSRCYCWPNFSGERCEVNHCKDYCQNGGTCSGSPLGKCGVLRVVTWGGTSSETEGALKHERGGNEC